MNCAADLPRANLVGYRSDHPKVFFHCHAFPPDYRRFAPDGVTGLMPGTVAHLSALARDLGFERVTAISPCEVPEGRATARIDEGKDGLKWLAEESVAHPEVLSFANLDPSRKDSAARLEKAYRDGFAGVKLHPVIGRFSIDVERDEDFYSLVNAFRLPLVVHLGVLPGRQPWPIRFHHPLLLDDLASRFPEMPLIMAHGGGRAFCRDVLAVMQSNPNTYLDLTHTLDKRYAWHLPADDLAAFFDQVGPSRIIYGTDYPWYGPADLSRDLSALRRLGIDKAGMDLIMGGTFAALSAESRRS